jgi:hypothetical protein
VPFLRVHDVVRAQFLKIQVTAFCKPAWPMCTAKVKEGGSGDEESAARKQYQCVAR